MTLNPEFVSVVVGGIGFDAGWLKVQVTASMREAVRNFQLETSESEGAFKWPPGTPIKILSNGQQLLDGYVNRYQPKFDANSHTVTVSGRSKGQDFVDCSAKHGQADGPNYWESKTPEDIGKDLDLYGVGIKAEVPLDKLEYFQLSPGQSAHKNLERAMRDQEATIMADENGSGLLITNATKAKRHTGGLIEGLNIKQASATLSDDRKFSEYGVKGQRRREGGDANLRINEKVKGSVQRYRNKLVLHEEDSSIARAKKRAQHECDRSEGFSIACEIETQGWRDDGGKCWQPNYLIFVFSPKLKINGDMLIEAVTFEQDGRGGGSTSKLHLVHPKAYKGKTGKSGTDSSWG